MNKSKKVLIVILSLLLMVSVFGSVTYAWITLSSINSIEELSLKASSGDELQMSFDGINFSTSLPMDEFLSNPEGISLYDVTSVDGINFETGGLREKGEAIPNEHYISFDVWFRTYRNEHDVYLYNNISSELTFDDENRIGTYVISKGVTWRSPHQFFNGPNITDVVEAGDVGTYYGSEAIRISIIELNDDLNALDVRSEDELEKFMFDPSGNTLRGYGTLFGQYSYFFQRSMIYVDRPDTIPEVSFRLSEVDPNNPYQALDNESRIAQLQPTGIYEEESNKEYYQGKVRVNIWIEGWDADAFDAIDKDRIKIQLQFKLAQRAIN